jgi:hypothetical protein
MFVGCPGVPRRSAFRTASSRAFLVLGVSRISPGGIVPAPTMRLRLDSILASVIPAPWSAVAAAPSLPLARPSNKCSVPK